MQLTAVFNLAAGMALAFAGDGKPSAIILMGTAGGQAASEVKLRIEHGPRDWAAPFGENRPPSNGKGILEHTVILPPSMRVAIQRHDPDFRAWREADYIPSLLASYKFSSRQTPFAVVGDFNDDKTLDLILAGHNKTRNLILVILSRAPVRGGFRVFEFSSTPFTDPKKDWYGMGGNRKEFGFSNYLTYIGPQKIASPYEKEPLDLETDAFQVNVFEKGAATYYYSDCEFLPYITSD